MYLVVSKWEALPGREGEFEKASPAVRAVLRGQPGVTLAEGFKSDGHYVVVHGYENEAAYQTVVHSDGAFQKALANNHLEDLARWVSSERGETLP